MNNGCIYILTNPSFPEYVKIGYASNLENRLKQLNRSETIPFAFRAYAIYEVEKALAVRQTVYEDLMKRYENPIEHTCDVKEGQVWISEDGRCPEGMCPSAWYSMKEFVESLARGEGNFYDGWMQNPMSAMISCNDGFRPFSFYIEAVD